MNSDSRDPWPQVVGAFIINFGNAEMVLFQWIDKFSTDKIVRDISTDLPLHKRLSLICDLIQRSELPPDRKQRAIDLWGEISKVSEIRNKIAHSPFVTHNGQHGILDIKKLKGSRGQVPVIPLSLVDIASAGSRLAKTLQELIEKF